MNNWANEYADYSKDRPDTLVTHNTYLDVPKDWLGPQFIQEAEILKDINYRAYQHEYLGLAIGTGGTVFPNVEDFDMQQPVDVSSPYDLLPDYQPMWKTFDKIYTGLDWGFSVDPTRVVRCHFDSTRLDLYIFYEYNTVATRNQFIFEELYESKDSVISKEDLVIADSAEPKSIADFKAYGAHIKGAQKGPESVRYGIKWLQGLRHIYIDRRLCPLTYKEFTEYEYLQDKEGNFVSEVPDEDNHSIDCTRYALERWYKRRGK